MTDTSGHEVEYHPDARPFDLSEAEAEKVAAELREDDAVDNVAILNGGKDRGERDGAKAVGFTVEIHGHTAVAEIHGPEDYDMIEQLEASYP